MVMPETDLAVATMVAERLRRRIASEPFPIQQGGRSIEVTISVGISSPGSAPATTRPPCSSVPTRRSTGPSATAAIGSFPTPREGQSATVNPVLG